MQIIIEKRYENETDLCYYYGTEGRIDKKAVSVLCRYGKIEGSWLDGRVNVIVKNAAHRTWGGMGKEYESAEKAIAHYRTPKTKAIIAEAVEWAKKRHEERMEVAVG